MMTYRSLLKEINQMKTINAKIVEKTVAELYYNYHFGGSAYTGYYFHETSLLSFTGTKANKLYEDYAIFYIDKKEKDKKKWENNHVEKIKALEDKLQTVVDGWFNKPSIEIKKDLEKEKSEKYEGISMMMRHYYDIEFLVKYPHVKIGKDKHSTFYEILI